MPKEKIRNDGWDYNRNVRHELTECDKIILAEEYPRQGPTFVNSGNGTLRTGKNRPNMSKKHTGEY